MIPSVNLKRSVFDRSHDYKTTLDSGYLVPFYVDEVLPGDSFKLNVATFARMNTPIVPFMDNVYLETFFFFVPTRLVWDNWQKFNGEQKNPGDSTDFLVPTLSNSGSAFNFQNGTIFDYFGLPTNVAIPTAPVTRVESNNLVWISSLPFRAYNLIYNEWFRDENLQNSVNVPTGDGPDLISNYTLLKRGKRHDYFTSALPWPQKGPAVDVGLSGNAPVVGFDGTNTFSIESQGTVEQFQGWKLNGGGRYEGIQYTPLQGNGHSTPLSALPNARFDNTLGFVDGNADDTYHPMTSLAGQNYSFDAATLVSNSEGGIYADLSGVNAITINDLRQAFQIQKLLERDARGGTRYTEILRSHFGVISPDARLQRPEYLGGSRSRMNIGAVFFFKQKTAYEIVM